MLLRIAHFAKVLYKTDDAVCKVRKNYLTNFNIT